MYSLKLLDEDDDDDDDVNVVVGPFPARCPSPPAPEEDESADADEDAEEDDFARATFVGLICVPFVLLFSFTFTSMLGFLFSDVFPPSSLLTSDALRLR